MFIIILTVLAAKFSGTADSFCPVTDQNVQGFTYIAQLDFDIFGLSDIDNAEACAYKYYEYDNSTNTNYIQNSYSSYCSEISSGYNITGITSSKVIDKKTGWVCIPVTDILNQNLDSDYSNMFIDWSGENINGGKGPFSCFRGIDALERCNNSNPSGAGDCRPYLKITYK